MLNKTYTILFYFISVFLWYITLKWLTPSETLENYLIIRWYKKKWGMILYIEAAKNGPK